MEHKQPPESEQFHDLNLEDIVREFSDTPPLDEFLQEFAPETPVAPTVSIPGDTIRLDRIQSTIQQNPSLSNTRRFAAVPIDDEPEEETVAPPPPKTEPFSEGWEPEYEQPMGTYPVQEPIPFRQRDRLRQLREQLVQHTEHRFYELAEMGTAGVRLAGFIIFLIFLATAGASLAMGWGYIDAARIKPVGFCLLLAMLLTALLCHNRLLEGAASLLKGRFTLNTFLLFSFVICCGDSLLCLLQQRLSCCCLFCLQAAAAQWATCHARNREMLQMDTLRKASSLTAVVKKEDYHQGRSGYIAGEGQLSSFTDHYRTPSGPEQALNIYAAVALVLSLAVSLLVSLRSDWATGLQVLVAMTGLALPATAFVSMRTPEILLEKRLHALGTVLCGWQGVKAVDKRAVVPMTHADLFPKDAIGINGMKFYGSVDPDMVLCYAGSLISCENGSLTPVFDQLMASRYIRHAPVEELGSYPGGLSALVDGEPVAVGTLEFMRQMSVDVPVEAQIPSAVYAAVDGVLSGVFALRFSRSKPAAAGLRNLCSHRRATPVLISQDFMLTGRFLQEKLKVNTKRLVLPEGEVRAALQETEISPEDPVIALTVRTGLPQRSFAVTGAWALRSAQRGGALIHIIGGGLGLAAVAVLALIGSAALLTPLNLLLYSLLWLIPGWLAAQWTRYI